MLRAEGGKEPGLGKHVNMGLGGRGLGKPRATGGSQGAVAAGAAVAAPAAPRRRPGCALG